MTQKSHEDLPVPKSASSKTPHPSHAGQAAQAGSLTVPDPETLVEVYRTDNEIAAIFVRDEILGPAGIYAALHNRVSTMLSAPAAMPGQIGIAVAAEHAPGARTRLQSARKDGVLLDGDFIE